MKASSRSILSFLRGAHEPEPGQLKTHVKGIANRLAQLELVVRGEVWIGLHIGVHAHGVAEVEP
jgi:hypothetical protein